MSQQLGLDLEPAPTQPRSGVLESFHVRCHVTAGEAVAGERRAQEQDSRVLQLFRECAKDADDEDPDAGQRLTPSEVLTAWGIVFNVKAPPITSIRRAITNLTKCGLLVHHPEDRRLGPHGAKESTWSLP